MNAEFMLYLRKKGGDGVGNSCKSCGGKGFGNA